MLILERCRNTIVMPLSMLLSLTSAHGWAASISESNKVLQLPLFNDSATTCSAKLFFKPVANNDQHAFVVVRGPDGKELELRGGPSKGGNEHHGSGSYLCGIG